MHCRKIRVGSCPRVLSNAQIFLGGLVHLCRKIVRQNLVGVDQRFLEDSVILKYLAWGQDRIRNLNDFVRPEFFVIL